MKHTPGPWTAKGFSVTKSNGFKITQQRPAGAGDWEEADKIWEADAKLIAAAPDMLAALIMMTESTEWSCMINDEQDQILNAIKLATT